MLISYIPIRMSALGASDLDIGVAVGARGLLPFLLALSLGRIADRLGGRQLLVPSMVLMLVVGLLHGVAETPLTFAVLQALFGLSTVGVWITLQAVITHAGTGAALRTHLAFFSFMWGLGIAVGPVLGAVLYDGFGFRALTYGFALITATVGLSALVIPWATARAAERAAADAAPFWQSVGSVARRPAVRSVLLASFATQYTFSIRNSFYPVVLERNGVGVTEIGLLLSVAGFASLAIRMVLPLLLRRFRSGPLLVATTLSGAIAITATPVLGSVMPALLVAAIVMGIAVGVNPPITVELLARYTTAAERGLSAGMRVMVNRGAQVLQPLVFGSIAAVGGALAAWPASAVILGALTASMARALRQVREPPTEPPRSPERDAAPDG
jgi:MFS family permease